MTKKRKVGNEEKWSQLPALLMWMIKDRLTSFVDHVYLASACKNWKAACEKYPFKPQRQCVAPWVMHRNWNSCPITATTISEFVNMSNNEKLILDLPELLKADFLNSKQGWLLLRKTCKIGRDQPLQISIILLNLHTNAKIIMPDPGDCLQGFMASFSTSADGNPECVVFDVSSATSKTLCIAMVGDEKWTKYSYGRNGRRMDSTASLAVRGNKIYCLEELEGSLFIFDMENLLWREVMGYPEHSKRRTWLVESEAGELLKIERGRNWKTFGFFKLNDSETGWEELSHSDLEGRSWLLSIRQNNQFTVKETGGMKKVYELTVDPLKRNRWNYSINIHDVINGSMKSDKPNKDVVWVDLGAILKIPPSCVGYVPPSLL